MYPFAGISLLTGACFSLAGYITGVSLKINHLYGYRTKIHGTKRYGILRSAIRQMK